MKVSGVVEKLYQNSAGFWSVVVNGTFYGMGKFRPKAEEGYVVRFDAVPAKNPKYWNVDGKIEVVGDGAVLDEDVKGRGGSDVAAAPAPTRSGGSGWKPDPTRDMNESAKQKIISRQSAQNTAVAFLVLAKDLGAIPIAANKNAGDKLEALTALKDKLTEEFYAYSLGTEAGSVEAEKAEAPNDDEWKN